MSVYSPRHIRGPKAIEFLSSWCWHWLIGHVILDKRATFLGRFKQCYVMFPTKVVFHQMQHLQLQMLQQLLAGYLSHE